MIELLIIPVVSFLASYVLTPRLMPKLLEAGIRGKDMNKGDKPEVPEMGGVCLVSGFVAGLLVAIALILTFVQLAKKLAALSGQFNVSA